MTIVRGMMYSASIWKVNIEQDKRFVIGHYDSSFVIEFFDTKRIFSIKSKVLFAISDNSRPTLEGKNQSFQNFGLSFTWEFLYVLKSSFPKSNLLYVV
jgi:hypothetical protein